MFSLGKDIPEQSFTRSILHCVFSVYLYIYIYVYTYYKYTLALLMFIHI